MRSFVVALSLLGAAYLPLRAQTLATSVTRPFFDGAPSAQSRISALQDSGKTPVIFWRASTQGVGRIGRRGFRIEPAVLRTELNSGYASDRNNGSLWGGRGINTQVSAGVGFGFANVSASIRPEFNFQQNREFETRPVAAGRSPFGNAFYGSIDLPQRFGGSSYSSVAPGQSHARLDISALGIGISTENMWWGPGLRESIVLGNSARGFPHALVEANRPVDVGFGLLGGSLFWGRLSESAYLDTIPANDHRLLSGLGITFQPKGLEDLTLGFTRLFTYAWDSLSVRNFIPFAEPVLKESLETPDNPTGSNADDQRLSVFLIYTIRSAGFEVYAEFGREDHSYDWRDLVGEPEHSAAYLIGFQSLRLISASRSVRVQGEWVNLQGLRAPSPARSTPRYYLHRPQGHTEGGQMLGASIGPGAESQFLAVDVLTETVSAGGFLERVRRNELAAPAVASRQGWPPLHDVELTAGVRGSRRVGAFDISAQASYTYRLERDFISDDSNLRLVLQADWLHPGSGR